MPQIDLSFANGEDSLSVRRFSAREAVSALFEIFVWAVSPHPDIDLDALVGQAGSIHVASGWFSALLGGGRRWGGVVRHAELVQAEPTGVSTYHFHFVPTLWLATQRKNLRLFQHKSVPDVAELLLGEWGIVPVWQIDRAAYPKLEYKVQYGETDFAFFCRILAEAGLSFLFQDASDSDTSPLLISDQLHAGPTRAGPPLPFVDNPSRAPDQAFVTRVVLSEDVRPTAVTLSDHDFRNPSFPLKAEAKTPEADTRLEVYAHRPGSFLAEGPSQPGTPTADDLGFARSDPRLGQARADRALLAEQVRRKQVRFAANAVDLSPGAIVQIADHPHPAIAENERLLVLETLGEGSVNGPWTLTCRAVFAAAPYMPLSTERPRASGLENAFVVGPPGQEIYTDEHGRVRVQFPWDRAGKNDSQSSVWMRVSQGWAGTGFGVVTIPRVGQEVLVGFLDGDPEQPIIVGRVFNAKSRLPYKLPDHKMVSTWKTESTPGGGGFNEIVMDDTKGLELFGVRAERDLRKLVKHDETSTVGRHKKTLVKGDEVEFTNGDHTTYVGKDRKVLVEGDTTERTMGNVRTYVGKDTHSIVAGDVREQVEKEVHLTVGGSLLERVGKTLSVTVDQDHLEKVGGRLAVEAAKEIHMKTGAHLVIEAPDITVKGPGGFVRVDAGGVTIKGTLVKINSSGGGPGSGSGAAPEAPERPEEAKFEVPEMDDVSKSGHGP